MVLASASMETVRFIREHGPKEIGEGLETECSGQLKERYYSASFQQRRVNLRICNGLRSSTKAVIFISG